MRDSFALFGATFPGYQRTPVRIIKSVCAVISQYTLTGKHTGAPFLEQAALGTSFGIHGLLIVGASSTCRSGR